MEQWMSLRAYARHRGVALSAVQKAIESRRVTAIREEGGRIRGIEKNQADAQWAKNTDPVEAARNGKLEQPAPAAPIVETPKAAEAPASGAQGDYLVARAMREDFLAKQAKLDYLEQIGQLVSTADVERENWEVLTQVKSNVYQLADSKAQILAAEGDAARIALLMRSWFDKVFDELSNRFANDAAGGTPEREAALP